MGMGMKWGGGRKGRVDKMRRESKMRRGFNRVGKG